MSVAHHLTNQRSDIPGKLRQSTSREDLLQEVGNILGSHLSSSRKRRLQEALHDEPISTGVLMAITAFELFVPSRPMSLLLWVLEVVLASIAYKDTARCLLHVVLVNATKLDTSRNEDQLDSVREMRIPWRLCF